MDMWFIMYGRTNKSMGRRPMQTIPHALEKEHKFFQKHRAELVREHEGEWVVVYDHTFRSFHSSAMEAFNHGFDDLGTRPFLVQEVCKTDRVQTFVSYCAE